MAHLNVVREALATKRRKTDRAQADRRSDVSRRKTVAEMSLEEMRRELLIDSLTGLGNRRAWEEADKGPVLGSLDMDALKWVNDNMGHASGDKMIAAMGEALNDVMPGLAFHVSGDEFLAHFEDQAQALRLLGEATHLLNQATVSVRLPDGTIITKTGIGYSYGTGTNLQDAEARLQRHKSRREQFGFRAARGGEPAGVVTEAPEREPDKGREAPAQTLMEEAITTAEAAELLGLSERQVQHLAASHQIPGVAKFGSAWKFPRKPRVLRPKRGRPLMPTYAHANAPPI